MYFVPRCSAPGDIFLDLHPDLAMKKIVALITLVVIAVLSHAQHDPLREKAIQVKRTIELNHFSPRAVDDSFSANLFKKTFNSLDPRRLYFTAAEFKSLDAYRLLLDDELNGSGWKFLGQVTGIYKNALRRADTIINGVLKKPFDFFSPESIQVGGGAGSFRFAATHAELENRWSRYLKFMALTMLADKADNEGGSLSPDRIGQLETAIRAKVKSRELKEINRLLASPESFEKMVANTYYNSIASCFDPHTNYFSPEIKAEFQSQLSSEGLSYGLEFSQNDDGAIVVNQLIPGGPAWKSGELHRGDELLAIYFEDSNDGETELGLEEVYEMLNRAGNEKLFLKVKKANGEQKLVALRKEKTGNAENIVRSVVLEGPHRVGYVLLPGFYTEWDNETGSGCANDVAKEIIKLKREKIDGLIIDVRFNGGGSLGEGLEMAGIFIDEGPLAAEKDSKGKVTFFKDPNRGLIYEGPLVLMVNGQSASASEMLAASLQDYHRGLIVGSGTYGKASMQRMLPADTNFHGQSLPADALKITIGKFYRLSGTSAQLNGVKPDVIIPDAFEKMELGERFQENVLPSDSIRKNTYYKPLPPLPVGELARRSAERLESDPLFTALRDPPARRRNEPRVIPLRWEDFQKWKKQEERAFGAGVTAPPGKFKVRNNQHDLAWIQDNEYEADLNKNWIKNIEEDAYICEAFFITCDLIKLHKPSSQN